MGNTIHEESNKISLQKAVPSLRFERKPLPYKSVKPLPLQTKVLPDKSEPPIFF